MRFALVANMLFSVAVSLCIGVLIYCNGAVNSAATLEPATDQPNPEVVTDDPSGNNDTPTSPSSTTSSPNPVTIRPDRINSLCSQLADTFNSLNTILPMAYYFNASQELGVSYPSGKISFESGARSLNGCASYRLPTSGAVIAHLEIVTNLQIQLPEYEIDGKNWTVSFHMEGCQVVLHYSIMEGVETDGSDILHMSVMMGELKSLGKVSIVSDYPKLNGRDFTMEADDVIRPQLFQAFNRFAKEQLTWHINPEGNDLSNDGFNSFKLIFKRQMILLNRAFTENKIA